MQAKSRLLANVTSKPVSTSAVTATPTKGKIAASGSGTRFSRKPPPPSLDHFIQRQRVIHLYRDILRRLYTIPASAKQQRDEFISHARSEFDRSKNVTDISQIRYLISTGKAEMKGWERMIQELAEQK